MPMLTQSHRLEARTSAVLLFLTILALMLALAVVPGTRADAPIVTTNPDASRTVAWTFGSPANLTLQNVELVGGRAQLPWRTETVAWSSSRFLANVSQSVNVSMGPSDLELLRDSTNYVANGDFATPSNWTFSNGTSGQVTATWDPAARDVRFAYNAGADWDTFDDQLTNWSCLAPSPAFCGISPESQVKVQGAGSMKVTLSISSTASWVSAIRTGTVNWSGWDNLVVWINPTNVTPPLSFNVTAVVAASQRTTTAIPLSTGWNEVVVDLNQLGSSQERGSLQDVRFRINGQGVPTTDVFFDEATLGTAHTLDESAHFTQTLTKTRATPATPGSGYLSFDWSWVNESGVLWANASAGLSGSNGTTTVLFGRGVPVGWQHSGLDVSAISAAVGAYTVSFQLHVVVNNVSASHANLRIDNVSLEWPNRGNGTYLSIPAGLPLASEFPNITWDAVVPGGTSVTLRARSGNGTDTGSPSWSPWRTWSAAGDYPSGLPAADHFQIWVDLNTTNASLSPILRSLSIGIHHRAAAGVIIADAFTASSDFLRWRSFNASVNVQTGTAITFLAGDGSSLAPVPPSGSLSGVQGPRLQWRADVSTMNGLQTPVLAEVQATYEFLGPADHILLTPSGVIDVEAGQVIQFSATVLDAGDHPVSASISWTTTDPTGSISNGGRYVAGSVTTGAPWYVNVTVAGSGKSASALVTVRPASLAFGAVLYPSLLAVIVLGAVYSGYTVWSRRAFAVDDVFLVSKEGRLMMHNTRRMRADRDEDILSAMLTAILSFLTDFDREENGDLKRFQLGGKTALLERGKNAYLAAVYSGRVPRWADKDLRRFMADLEGRFGEVFAHWSGDPEDLQGLKEFSDRFVARIRYRPARNDRGRAG
jgi:hypothetical protein